MKKKPPEKKMPKLSSSSNIIWIWIILFGFFIFNFYLRSNENQVSYDKFISLVEHGKVKEVTFAGDKIIAVLNDDSKPSFTYKVSDENLVNLLKSKGIKFQGTPENTFWDTFFIWMFPILLFFFLFRSFQGSQGSKLFAFNKSKARIYMEKDVKTSFDDVAGVEEAKEELLEVVNFLKEPEKYSRLGGRIPKGILLVGPPGTGKTLMAKAVAGEANVPFFSINGSEFVELFVGMGASRVRDLFEQARIQSPCIIFIDELDALGKARAMGQISGGANDEKEQTLNQLLAELDGFDSKSGVVLLAATNRPEVLDPALLRAGRFDRQVLIDNPSKDGRLQILKIHIRNIKIKKDLDLSEIASITPGFSGADLANLANEAALIATRRNASHVEISDFVKAIERIVAGLERKQRLINPKEKIRVAYHEMGHATLALALQFDNRVQKVSIIPRGIGSLGYTIQRPLEDRYLVTKDELFSKISVLLAGRASEQIFCNDISTGAGDDLVKASNIARSMITQYGMGESLGLVSEDRPSSRFLQGPNSAIEMSNTFSEKTRESIDIETKKILEKCKETAINTIESNRKFIEESVKELLQKETLESHEIEKLWKDFGKPVY